MKNFIQQAFDKLVTSSSITNRYIKYSKKHPKVKITYNGKIFRNGKITYINNKNEKTY